MKKIRLVSILLSLVFPVFASAGLVSTGVSFSGTNSGFSDGLPRMIGWQFTVGSNAIAVSELGFQDFGEDGLLESHEVGIWRLSDQVLMGSVVVPSGTSGTLDGFFRYAPLSTAAILESGGTYVISGLDSGIDPHVWDVEIAGFPNRSVTGFAVDSAITLGPPGTAHGPIQGSFGFPNSLTVPDARSAIMGPNFKFTIVPEPTTCSLLLLGITIGLVTRRKTPIRRLHI